MTTDQRYKLWKYLSDELNVSALEGQLDDIENIINPVVYPHLASEETPRELTLKPFPQNCKYHKRCVKGERPFDPCCIDWKEKRSK